jgi:hypothetical protein
MLSRCRALPRGLIRAPLDYGDLRGQAAAAGKRVVRACRRCGDVPTVPCETPASCRRGDHSTMIRLIAVALLAVAAATPAVGQGALPDPTKTPGALNPAVTQATIGSIICVRGWTRTIRPPQQYTSRNGGQGAEGARKLIANHASMRTMQLYDRCATAARADSFGLVRPRLPPSGRSSRRLAGGTNGHRE